MAGLLDSDLLTRLRRVVANRPVTEGELRSLGEEAEGWARDLRAQVEASERRLDALAADPASSVVELARELRRVERLYPTLAEAEVLLVRLEKRARQLRTGWLLDQAAAEHPLGERS